MDAPTIQSICSKLSGFEHQNNIRILLAVESGSRSWGFDSPDSDYDIRFIYAHRPEYYLSVFETRDVIELTQGDFDFAGWDLRKTLRLLHKSNPILNEWVVSPHAYIRDDAFAHELKNLIQQYYSTRACAYHYLHMLENNYREFISGKEEVSLKKYLYVLRPLANIMWLRDKQTLVPMSFTETLSGIRIPPDVMSGIECLLEAKRRMPELGKGSRIAKLDLFITESIAELKAFTESAPVSKVPIPMLDSFFQKTIKRIWK